MAAPVWDDSEIADDLRLYAAYRHAEKHFVDLLAEASNDKQPHVLVSLRQQPVRDLAEFLFVWKAYRITTREQVLQYVALHNQGISDLLADKERMRLYGFSPARLKSALFDDAAAAKLVVNYMSFEGSFDQRDLARLLVEQMSAETCRMTIAKLSETGFVKKTTGVYNAIIVTSSGKLEEIYMRYLRAFRGTLAGQPAGKKKKEKRP